MYLWSYGYGGEGQDDVGSTYRFVLGAPNSLPLAAVPAVLGMREGGRRRILVPPGRLGWDDKVCKETKVANGDAMPLLTPCLRQGQVGPQPRTFGGQRRLVNHREEPLLLEVDLRRVAPSQDDRPVGGDSAAKGLKLARPYSLPAPPSPFRSKLITDGLPMN